MLKREVYISGTRPVPISVLIQTTNKFGCDIFIESGHFQVNAKSYEELQEMLAPKKPELTFCFSGEDENLAVSRIEQLYHQ